jgi:hypothetical protein
LCPAQHVLCPKQLHAIYNYTHTFVKQYVLSVTGLKQKISNPMPKVPCVSNQYEATVLSNKFLSAHDWKSLHKFDNDKSVTTSESTTLLKNKSYVEITTNHEKVCKYSKACIWIDDFRKAHLNFILINKINSYDIKISKKLFWNLYKSNKAALIHPIKMMKRKINTIAIECFDKYLRCKDQQFTARNYFFCEVKNSEIKNSAVKNYAAF